jgi:hypothetical protein
MKHSLPYHQPHKNECTTVKTRRRKPISPPGHTLTQNYRPDSPQCSLPLPATPRRLILQQSMATKPSHRRASTSTSISACTSKASTTHTHTADRRSTSRPSTIHQQQWQWKQHQQPLSRPLRIPPLPNRRPNRPTTHSERKRAPSRLDALLPWPLQRPFHRRAERNPASRAAPRRHRDQTRRHPVPP